MILTRFCEEISKALYPLMHEISTNYEQDPNYKADEKAARIKALNMIKEEVDKNIMRFDTLDLSSEEYFESGFSKFLSIIMSVIENNPCPSKIVCESVSIRLLKWLEILREIKGVFRLYVIEVLLVIAHLKGSILRSNAWFYVISPENIKTNNSCLHPIDSESILIIKKIFSKDYVKSLYMHLVPQGQNMEMILQNALLNTYIVPLPSKVYGICLVNLTIFIRDCVTEKKSKFDKASECALKRKNLDKEYLQKRDLMINTMIKVFNAIVFCHEFSHVLQRSGCSNYGEAANFLSPNCPPPLDTPQKQEEIKITSFNDECNPSIEKNLNCFLENQELPVKRECSFDSEEIKEAPDAKNSYYLRSAQEKQHKETKKPEYTDTGFRMEGLLFGQILKFLNYQTALIFYEPELPNTLEELKNHFKTNNTVKHPKESVKMNRIFEDCYNGIIMGKCGMPKIKRN